jgi:hypothetical protein
MLLLLLLLPEAYGMGPLPLLLGLPGGSSLGAGRYAPLGAVLLGGTVPQVEQLGAAHLAAVQNLDLGDVWGVSAGGSGMRRRRHMEEAVSANPGS